jgi:aminobenzoyl-glutamate utilization protein B
MLQYDFGCVLLHAFLLSSKEQSRGRPLMIRTLSPALRLCVVAVSAVTTVSAASLSAQASPKQNALAAVERNREEIAKVGDAIFSFAELGMQEFETSALCSQVLSDIGYTVENGISGIPTAILATYGSGGPVIAIHVEYDAVPNGSQVPGVTHRNEVVAGAPGHAEGHNTNAAVWIGAAFAIKETMDAHDLTGTIKLFSAPAEEQIVSRPYFVRDGYFNDVDAAFHAHVGSSLSTSYGVRQYAAMSVEYEFFGKTAHAGASPWTGVSAADAVKLMDVGWDVLREHLPPTQRSHSVIVDGGVQPNVVPDYAKIWFYFRESTYEGAASLYERAHLIADGAATMTGTTWKEQVLAAVWPTRDNRTIAEVVQANIEMVGVPEWTAEEQALAREIQATAGVSESGLSTNTSSLQQATQSTSSNDSGDITWMVPHGRITFPANVPGVPFHHWAAAIAEATSIAHKGSVAGAKVMAASVIDLITDTEIMVRARDTFAREIGNSTYRPLLPEGQLPPIELNAEEMAKYREAMRAHYRTASIRFR